MKGWGTAVGSGEASLACLLCAMCYAAHFWIGHGLVPAPGPRVGDPSSKFWCFKYKIKCRVCQKFTESTMKYNGWWSESSRD